MARDIDTSELETSTAPDQNSSKKSTKMQTFTRKQVATALRPKRGETWVRQRGNFLSRVYYWCSEELRTPDGRFTQLGLEKMQELLTKTGNSKMGTKRGKEIEVPKTPDDVMLSLEEYASWVWTEHDREPVEGGLFEEGDPEDTNPVSTPRVNNAQTQAPQTFRSKAPRQVFDVAFVEIDPDEEGALAMSSEGSENSQLFFEQSGEIILNGVDNFFTQLRGLGDYLEQGAELYIVGKATAGVNKGLSRAQETVAQSVPSEAPQVQVKKTRKSRSS